MLRYRGMHRHGIMDRIRHKVMDSVRDRVWVKR